MTKQEQNDGGPAFPIEYMASQGMSLRDWFAGQALMSWRIDAVDLYRMEHGEHVDCRFIAEHSYAIADAMLKAREVHP